MILVLSSQRFPPLILVSDGNVFFVISTFERNQPSSERFIIRFLERSISAFMWFCLHVSRCRITQFFSLLLPTFFPFLLRSTASLPSVSLCVTSSHYSTYVSRFVDLSGLAFSTFLCMLARLHDIVLFFLRFSAC